MLEDLGRDIHALVHEALGLVERAARERSSTANRERPHPVMRIAIGRRQEFEPRHRLVERIRCAELQLGNDAPTLGRHDELGVAGRGGEIPKLARSLQSFGRVLRSPEQAEPPVQRVGESRGVAEASRHPECVVGNLGTELGVVTEVELFGKSREQPNPLRRLVSLGGIEGFARQARRASPKPFRSRTRGGASSSR